MGAMEQTQEGLSLYKIMTKGCPLKHQPEIHHHYAMKALCFYEDFYPLVRRMQMEREVQLCVDIAAHLLSETGAPVPDTMAGTFRTLSAQGTLTLSLADKLCKAVGFRNIAVHQYQDINQKILYAVVTEHLQDFRDFAKAVVVLMGS